MLCAGVEGEFAIDDAYCRRPDRSRPRRRADDSAVAATRLAGGFANARKGHRRRLSAANIRTRTSTTTSRGARGRACSTSFRATSAVSAPQPKSLSS